MLTPNTNKPGVPSHSGLHIEATLQVFPFLAAKSKFAIKRLASRPPRYTDTIDNSGSYNVEVNCDD